MLKAPDKKPDNESMCRRRGAATSLEKRVKFGIGQSVPRSKIPRLITGGGQYTDDINRLNQLYIRILRSPYAHGIITELDAMTPT